MSNNEIHNLSDLEDKYIGPKGSIARDQYENDIALIHSQINDGDCIDCFSTEVLTNK